MKDQTNPYISTLIQRELMQKWFALPNDFAATLDKYYIHHWTGSYVEDKIYLDTPHGDLHKAPIIEHQGITYYVIFLESKLTKLEMNSQYRLSFRKQHTEPVGYVLIKGIY